jgi:hypothetical protein
VSGSNTYHVGRLPAGEGIVGELPAGGGVGVADDAKVGESLEIGDQLLMRQGVERESKTLNRGGSRTPRESSLPGE